MRREKGTLQLKSASQKSLKMFGRMEQHGEGLSKIFYIKSRQNVNQVEHLVVLGTFLCLPSYNVNFQMKLWFFTFSR